MTRVNPIARPTQGAEDPTSASCDPVPEGLVERITEAIHDEEP